MISYFEVRLMSIFRLGAAFKAQTSSKNQISRFETRDATSKGCNARKLLNINFWENESKVF